MNGSSLKRVAKNWLVWVAIAGAIVFLVLMYLGDSSALRKEHTWADLIAVWSALFALALGVDQIVETKRLITKTEVIVGQVQGITTSSKEIAQAISTQFIGQFPDNLDALCHLAERTRHSFRILCDVTGYGHFSRPEAFLRYRQALEKLAVQKCKVSVVAYDRDKAREARIDQLGRMQGPSWEQFKHDTVVEHYFELFPQKMELGLRSAEDFSQMIEDNDKDTRQLFRASGIRVGVTKTHMPMFMWIRDEEDDAEAIICFIAKKQTALEYAFRTSDPRLIHALLVLGGPFFDKEATKWSENQA